MGRKEPHFSKDRYYIRMYKYRERSYSVGSKSAEQFLKSIIKDCKLNKISQQQTRDNLLFCKNWEFLEGQGETGQAHRKENNTG